MTNRLIANEGDRRLLIRFIQNHQLPFTATIIQGNHRSIEQNRLQWLWASEAAGYREDTPPREIQLEWKLNFGVPILCAEDEGFAAMWASSVSKSYKKQLELIEYLSVTSLMTSKQLSNYLTQIYRFYTEKGIKLTNPEDLRYETHEEARP